MQYALSPPKCDCPSGTKLEKGKCLAPCPLPKVWDATGTRCDCAADKPVLRTDCSVNVCGIQCHGKKVASCEKPTECKCPSGYPYEDGTGCYQEECKAKRHRNGNGECVCPAPLQWDGVDCKPVPPQDYDLLVAPPAVIFNLYPEVDPPVSACEGGGCSGALGCGCSGCPACSTPRPQPASPCGGGSPCAASAPAPCVGLMCTVQTPAPPCSGVLCAVAGEAPAMDAFGQPGGLLPAPCIGAGCGGPGFPALLQVGEATDSREPAAASAPRAVEGAAAAGAAEAAGGLRR